MFVAAILVVLVDFAPVALISSLFLSYHVLSL
jgi:hypothetical protein